MIILLVILGGKMVEETGSDLESMMKVVELKEVFLIGGIARSLETKKNIVYAADETHRRELAKTAVQVFPQERIDAYVGRLKIYGLNDEAAELMRDYQDLQRIASGDVRTMAPSGSKPPHE